MYKSEVIEKFRAGNVGDSRYIELIEVLLAEMSSVSDGDLIILLESLTKNSKGPQKVSEARKVTGDDTIVLDVILILGADRGLWDDLGYNKEPEVRIPDANYGKLCVDMVHELWYKGLFIVGNPFLINLVLKLKHGVRIIDDESLLEIGRMVMGPWRQENEGNEIFDCRLLTLRLAVTGVLRDRGYRDNQIKSGYV